MKQKSKIHISRISTRARQSRGFDESGCFGCACVDGCCRYGADFDLETVDLLLQHRSLIEARIGRTIEDCFETTHGTNPEFLGGGSWRSRTGQDGFCVFHKLRGKGCVLFELALHHGCPPRIVPTICRLFPLTWDRGEILFYDELPDGEIPLVCNIRDPENRTSRLAVETQKLVIEDVFDCDAEVRNLLERGS